MFASSVQSNTRFVIAIMKTKELCHLHVYPEIQTEDHLEKKP